MLKKLFLLLSLLTQFSLTARPQGFFSTGTFSNSNFGSGAANIFGWGENFDRTFDVRPNPHPYLGTMIVNYHTGLTFSAHSFYGGIRFYNQGYPNAYDPATGSVMVMAITNGNVGIGTSNPDAKLAVNGTIHAKEIRVDLNVPGADYVFEKSYPLKALAKVNKYIAINHHLPDIPSAKSMEKNGIDVSEINMKLLQKIEELTLYLIEKDKKDGQQQAQINSLNRKLKVLSRRVKNR